MNDWFVTGRLTRDPDVRYTQGDSPKQVARFSLAVDGAKGRTDFFNFVAWERQAEVCEKHLKKGMKVTVHAIPQTGSYTDKDGRKVSTFDGNVARIDFYTAGGGFVNIESENGSSGDLEGLPFN